MNYLAHAYLSFGDEGMLVGNMISDFVKGKNKFNYSLGIQNGITLHRSIDRFTDEHPDTKKANQFFKPSVRLYAGAFTDVVYDHFLAIDPQYWKEIPLAEFSSEVYATLNSYRNELPQQFQQMLPYMASQDWLYNYQFKWGIGKSFAGVARRAVYLDNADAVFDAFEKNYDDLQQISQSFIADVKKFALSGFAQLVRA